MVDIPGRNRRFWVFKIDFEWFYSYVQKTPMLHTKAEAARLVGVSRATLYAHIKEGRISVTNGKIDTSELLRVYGQLKQAEKVFNDVQPDTVLDVLRGQVEFLQDQLKQAQERERRLLDLVETQARALTHQSVQDQGSGFGSWFRRK